MREERLAGWKALSRFRGAFHRAGHFGPDPSSLPGYIRFGSPRFDGTRHDEVQMQRVIVKHLADHLLVFSPQSCKLVRVGAQRRHELGENGLLLQCGCAAGSGWRRP